MKSLKKLTAVMLAAALCFTSFTMNALADEPMAETEMTGAEIFAAEAAEAEEASEAAEDAVPASDVQEDAADGLLSAGVPVTMAKAAPEVGTAITVTKPGTISDLKWFVYAQGAEKGGVVSTTATYTPVEGDLNKWIEVQA